MKDFIEFLKWLFAPAPPVVTDEECPYCRGMGYDSSGYTCSCLREKK